MLRWLRAGIGASPRGSQAVRRPWEAWRGLACQGAYEDERVREHRRMSVSGSIGG